ncbi:hypothetical protein PG990_009976 [Apiospora arundinis]
MHLIQKDGQPGGDGCGEVEEKLLAPIHSVPNVAIPLLPPMQESSTGSSFESDSSRGCAQIAICGMGMRLPGGISSEDQFWDFLVNKKDARAPIPPDRYNVEAFHGQADKAGVIKTTHGYFLEDVDLAHLDASFFSMTRSELEKLDPQHRLLLEVTRETLESAAEVDWRGKNVGCYVGVFGEDWQDLHSKDTQDAGLYRITGYGDFLLANRVSYEYDLKGPSVTIKTGCSSALTCLHMACEALKNGDISGAVVGGTNLIMSPTMTQAMFEQGVLSPNGSCRTFDADADGYARGEAINAVYLKRLEDAIRDGNPIRAIVRATSSNCDGSTPGISHPSSESHEALIRNCYQSAGLDDFSETAFVECHGTGTSTGDPLEAIAVANVFGEKGVYIGSVKPNLGHSEGASGLTSIIKSVLALEKNTIPPNIKFETPNPRIPFGSGRLQVPVESVPWPTDRKHRVSINSFGIGGANAHVILDSPWGAAGDGVETPVNRPPAPLTQQQQQLLVFSANHVDSVRKGTENYTWYTEKHPGNIQRLAYTLGARREHLPYRSFALSVAGSPVTFSTPTKAPSASPGVIFAFTGQGAQWPTMGSKLLSEFSSVREDFEYMGHVLAQLDPPPYWALRGELSKDKTSSRVSEAELSQPLCTAVQIAIVNLLRRWGVSPAAVVGHSSGELAAAYASGALTMGEAIIGAYLRGLVTTRLRREGAMAAVGLGRDEVMPYLVDGVVIACENSPASTTLSGDREKIDVVVEKLKRQASDVFIRHLQVDKAYHSSHMAEAGEEYEALMAPHMSSKAPDVPFFSSVTNEEIRDAGLLNASYWRANLESPVRFNTAMSDLLANSPDGTAIVEIGPHSALAGPIRQILKAKNLDNPYIPTLARSQDDVTSLLTTAGQLFLKAVKIDFRALSSDHTALHNLPNYPWNHDTRYWHESRLSKDWRTRTNPHHDILGSQVIECSKLEPIWRNMLRLPEVPWCRDHVIGPDIIFPGAGYVAMAGEAVRQLSGSNDYTIRQLTIESAMMLRDSVATETMFTMRPLRLTTSLESAWYEFTVMSYDGSVWTKHCFGQVRGGVEERPLKHEQAEELPRHVSSSGWYQTMRKVGLNYGPRFQGLESISTSPSENVAMARVENVNLDKESSYPLHPAAMDCCIQLLSAAAARGLPRSFGKLSVPTYFGEIQVKSTVGKVLVEASAQTSSRGALNGTCIGTIGGEVVFSMDQVKLSPIGDSASDLDENPHAGVRLQWKPDIDFLPKQMLIRSTKSVRDPYSLVQKLVFLSCLDARERIAELDTGFDHMKKFKTWLDGQVDLKYGEDYPFLEYSHDLSTLAAADRKSLIREVSASVAETEACDIGIAISRVLGSIEGIFTGDVAPMELLLEGDLLTKLYDFADGWDYTHFLQLLSHSKPHLRILEIGAGTGATTAVILKDLVSEFGERMFYSYTYTDISTGFFAAAKERFRDFSADMEFLPLDISRDPSEQGFELGSFDLIIATNVIHATPTLTETLGNVRKLLQHNGKFLLQELCTTAKWPNFIMGVLPGWWLGENDGRLEEPYVNPDAWKQALSQAGFSSPDAVVLDDEMPYQTNATIVASPLVQTDVSTTAAAVSILCSDRTAHMVTNLTSALESRGFAVDTIGLTDEPKHDVISLLDLEEGAVLENVSEEKYNAMQSFLLCLGSFGIVWVTRSCQMACSDPKYAQIIGLARTLRNEMSIDIATLEIDTTDDQTISTVIPEVFGKFCHRVKEGDVDPEYEYALCDELIHIPRFHWISVADSLAAGTSSGGLKHLEIGQKGSLKSLQWVERPRGSLGDADVRVDVRAVGMNFKDILITMGIVDGNIPDGDGLGCECAGVITEVGANVRDLEVGDRVAIFAADSYSTVLRTKSDLCTKIPADLSFEDAATMPCVYATVIHGLLDLAHLEKDQTVLIHSACGGVGIAAIQICQMVGAKILATVGNEDKVQYLVDTFKIPRECIFSSRSISFLTGVLEHTKGEGVNVVLNSLSGELLHTSWKCVAEFGKMVEIGKRDFIGQGRLSMETFEANRSFLGVDLAQIGLKRPDMIKKLLDKCMDFLAQGAIGPIRPTTYFDAAEIQDAFRFMQKGQHIGKIVVRMSEEQSGIPSVVRRTPFALKHNASYLLVGGLGGLGRSISRWMVDRGAKSIIYLSRNAGKGPEDAAFFNELAAAGCNVQAVAGSVDKLEDVQAAVESAGALPIKGVLQMSMVLRDGGFRQMTYEDWSAVSSPKVQGTWNLHKAFDGHDLDFFTLFSSFSGLVGQWGQANYAAANTFLDAFAQFRRAKGLPASVIDIGAMDDVGYVSQNSAVMEQFRATAVHILREQDLLDSLELSINQSTPGAAQQTRPGPLGTYMSAGQLGIGLRMTQPILAPNNRSIWRRDIRMSLYRNLESAADEADTSGNDEFKELMASIANNPRLLLEQASVDALAREIGATIFGFMMKPLDELDVKAGPASLGMDSLVAIELKNWFRQRLGLEMSVLEIMNATSIERLAQAVAEGLMIKSGLGVRDGDTFLLMKAP